MVEVPKLPKFFLNNSVYLSACPPNDILSSKPRIAIGRHYRCLSFRLRNYPSRAICACRMACNRHESTSRPPSPLD